MVLWMELFPAESAGMLVLSLCIVFVIYLVLLFCNLQPFVLVLAKQVCLSLVTYMNHAMIAPMWTKKLFVFYQQTNVNEANIYLITREIRVIRDLVVRCVMVDIIVLPAQRVEKSVLLAFRRPLLKLLLAHHPQLRHVLMEAVNTPISTAAFCVLLALIKTELVLFLIHI